YQEKPDLTKASKELATVKLRYKQPDGDTSKLISRAVRVDEIVPFAKAPVDLQFTAAVAAFGMKLGQSENIGEFSFAEIERIAAGAIGTDPGGHRSEFTGLVSKAEALSAHKPIEQE
ncbi:MAG TPA: YfbK domain-containing protein, partial [Oceanipulchritudo sp.]|nr:YfbK domain-containing protein [Oceanipulchritudo sp.]